MGTADTIESGNIEDLFEQVSEMEAHVIAVHAENVEDTLIHFSRLCRVTGRSIYHWDEQEGLKSLKETEISVPGSRRLTEALRYVLQSMHYGVYVLTGFERQLRQPTINLLRQIARIRTGYDRKVVLLGTKVSLPSGLNDVVKHVVHQRIDREKPKLRDGRWVF